MLSAAVLIPVSAPAFCAISEELVVFRPLFFGENRPDFVSGLFLDSLEFRLGFGAQPSNIITHFIEKLARLLALFLCQSEVVVELFDFALSARGTRGCIRGEEVSRDACLVEVENQHAGGDADEKNCKDQK